LNNFSTHITGISEGFHDACKSIITKDGEIVYAGHAERYSRVKNDRELHPNMPLNMGITVFYERPFLKNTRRFWAGQSWKKRPKYDHYIPHHWSHAAASYYTRPFPEEPVCVVIDAIGEWDTASIWWKRKKVWSMKYPKSLGLFYSAVTRHIGLKPNEDEFITMCIAAMGNPQHDYDPYLNYHKGGIFLGKNEDVAASAQKILEDEVIKIMTRAKQYSDYLCYGGGVALNCVVNTKIKPMFKDMWIFPNPGDGGSSLGAALAYLDKRIQIDNVFFGYEIKGELDVSEVIDNLIKYKMTGVANGKSEFGPRAFGNRSLLADPRMDDVKHMVNKIKNRQHFRPFAPAILEEFADDYFTGPMNQYMQFVAHAKHDYDSVVHVNKTSRVQIVKDDGSNMRKVLEEWYERTKCPMLLNTSLNIKGEPLVNTVEDARRFEKVNGVPVVTFRTRRTLKCLE
jgi:carbamoyltransferase